MKNQLALAAFWSLLLSAFLQTGALATDSDKPVQDEEVQELVFFNWPDYIDPDVIKDFEAEFHTEVKEVFFDSDEDRDRIMVNNGGKGFDILLVNRPNIDVYHEADWISPLDLTRIPNHQNLDTRWVGQTDGASMLAIPYFWGTLGIAYREDLVPEPITRWKQIYQPREELKGKIVLTDDSWDIVGFALKTLGFSMNSEDPEELAAAESLVLKQKPSINRYSPDYPLSEQSALVKGAVAVTMMYNGDALTLQEFNKNIAYVVPEEGGGLWLDCLCISSDSRNKELASAFINFLNEPENAARNAEYLYYATPNLAAVKLLPREFLENPNIFPPSENIGEMRAQWLPIFSWN